MKPLSSPPEGLFFTAVLASGTEYYRLAETALIQQYGHPILDLKPAVFRHTLYYQSEMGQDLLKGFLGFPPPFSCGDIAQRKHETRKLEHDYSVETTAGSCRRVNIDPGYVNLHQVVLATSKNFSHRIYVGNGVFAEVTLLYRKSGWEKLPWTYPDYVIEQVQDFLTSCRNHLKQYRARST